MLFLRQKHPGERIARFPNRSTLRLAGLVTQVSVTKVSIAGATGLSHMWLPFLQDIQGHVENPQALQLLHGNSIRTSLVLGANGQKYTFARLRFPIVILSLGRDDLNHPPGVYEFLWALELRACANSRSPIDLGDRIYPIFELSRRRKEIHHQNPQEREKWLPSLDGVVRHVFTK